MEKGWSSFAMSVSGDIADWRNGIHNQSAIMTTWTINVADVKTVKVSNISLSSSINDIKEFLSFSGDIQYIEMQRENDSTLVAYVTFKDSQGADTAMLLSGACIADRSVMITAAEYYQLPPEALPPSPVKEQPGVAVKKAEDVVSTMLAKGYVLGKDALNKARAFDEQHHWIATASSAVASINHKIGLSETLAMGMSMVNTKAKAVAKCFQVYERTISTFAAAETTASGAGSAIMNNYYVLTGASWISRALSAVARAAEDVSSMTKEKVQKAEEERREILCRDRRDIISNFPKLHLDNSREPPLVPVVSAEEQKLTII
ncbi:hypothetical protein Ancab_018364 [Ancistrocladus abbreviatus]